MTNITGPVSAISRLTHAEKYRANHETFEEFTYRIANALKDNDKHYHSLVNIIGNQYFLPAGRVQSAMGSPKKVTAFNCFVSRTIEDSGHSIMQALGEAFFTMRMGGGIGYNFSKLRPRGAMIKSLESASSGPVSFMRIFDAMCGTVSSSGHRRGAQMGILNIDHPDIEEFIMAKTNTTDFLNFNFSVGVTDKFMIALRDKTSFDLTFEDKVCKTVDAAALWERLMRATWDWAEPGVIFIDRMNDKNNLWYCETIEATNPCGEQPLPPHGACLLGSVNLVKFIKVDDQGFYFDYAMLHKMIPDVVRAMDNIIDRTIYPLPEQEAEAKSKRRMGIGVTGLANLCEILGMPYGSDRCKTYTDNLLRELTRGLYMASIELAKEKGAFPLLSVEDYLQSGFMVRAFEGDDEISYLIRKHGIRNSHLVSFAPTGTISFCADNVSGSIEPVFSKEYTKRVRKFDNEVTYMVQDYAYKHYGIDPVDSAKLSIEDHVDMLCVASKWSDSAVSKTCNVNADCTWDRFKNAYVRAYDGGASGCTTFNVNGKRFGVQVATEEPKAATACYIDPVTGTKECA